MLQYIPLIGTDIMEMIRGGEDVGASTLLIFYNLHTGIFPLLLIAIMAFHFWRVRKAGGVILPVQKDDENSQFVTTIPNLVLREFVVALVLIAFILILSIFIDAPLLDKANPDFSPNPAKAPWYFLGIQELILHFHPLFASIIIPLTVIIILLLLPYFKYDSESSGEWFLSAKGKSMAILSAVTSLIITPSVIIIDEYLLDFSTWTPDIPNFISNGLLPFIILIAILSAYYQLIKKKFNATKIESIQALFILITVSFIILTITGILFRGPGMALGLP
ncbi:MAG: cytochrome b N-terminal domain-containing protein, partial [Melioribacteraceae bacterium]|nr:cytochrome b N-terminal domain-containing protein [Melioribacteraceae bacterium]